jgi:hypothetical protein
MDGFSEEDEDGNATNDGDETTEASEETDAF